MRAHQAEWSLSTELAGAGAAWGLQSCECRAFPVLYAAPHLPQTLSLPLDDFQDHFCFPSCHYWRRHRHLPQIRSWCCRMLPHVLQDMSGVHDHVILFAFKDLKVMF